MLLSSRAKVLSSFGAKCLRVPKRAGYASQAQVPLTECLDEKLVSHGSPHTLDLKTTQLPNGVKVISTDTSGGVSRVAVFVKAGSRYEDSSSLGVTHLLRNSAFVTNKSKSFLGIVREMQQHGVSLSVTNSRDYFIYTGMGVKGCLDPLLSCIASSVTGPLFQKWEVTDSYDLCLSDRDNMEAHPQLNVLDKLHTAAFRKGLGNSIYCEEHKLHSGDKLAGYMKKNFVGDKIAVVGLGCDHDDLVRNVSMNLGGISKGASSAAEKQKYSGGELRIESGSKLNHSVIAIEGAGHQSKNILTFGMLQYLMGSSPYIKWGSNTISSRLNRAAANATGNPFMVSSLNISHSDSGLFGVYTITEPQDTSKVLKAVFGEVKAVAEGKVKEEEVTRARNQLKAGILMTSENRDLLLEDIAHQMLANGSYKTAEEVCSSIDAVKLADIQKAANSLLSGKASYVVSGDCADAPYYDELI